MSPATTPTRRPRTSTPAWSALTWTQRLDVVTRGFVAGAKRRRSLPTIVHVGVPCGEARCFPVQPWYDASLRADLISTALLGLECPDPGLTITRLGGPVPTSEDWSWVGPATEGFGRHGHAPPAIITIGRYGWHSLLTGEHRYWSRLRPQPMAPYPQVCTGSLECIRWR